MAADDLLGLKSLIEAVRPFTDPVLKALGEGIAERLEFYNWRWSVKAIARARELLAAEGIAIGPVPPKLMVPILEGAALESEEELVERWACLLASASAGDDVLPAYPEILRQLTPIEVRMLDWISKQPPTIRGRGHDARRALGLEYRRFALLVGNLRRLGVAEIRGLLDGDQIYDVDEDRALVLTVLGQEFIRVCQGPRRDEPLGA